MNEVNEMPVTGETSPNYRLHGSPDSANLVVRMILEEVGAAYDYVPIDRLVSEQKSEAYRRLNPQGLIPVLEVEGQDAPMFETAAIILFLTDQHEKLAPLSSSTERGRFLKWLLFISNTLHSDLRIFFKPHRYFPDKTGLELLSKTLMSRITAHFGQMEQEIDATDGPFVLGDQISCLDHYLAACARWAQVYGSFDRWSADGSPRLQKLFETLELRPAVRQACKLEMIEGSPFVSPSPVTLPGITA